MIARCGAKVGIAGLHPHVLRHTFGTMMLSQPGVTIADVQRLMRHSDLRTTAIYLHVRDEDLKAKSRAAGAQQVADVSDGRKRARARGDA